MWSFTHDSGCSRLERDSLLAGQLLSCLVKRKIILIGEEILWLGNKKRALVEDKRRCIYWRADGSKPISVAHTCKHLSVCTRTRSISPSYAWRHDCKSALHTIKNNVSDIFCTPVHQHHNSREQSSTHSRKQKVHERTFDIFAHFI